MRIQLSPTVTLFHADCREALRSLPDCSVDSVPCDPPYALTSVSRNGSPRNNDPDTPFGRTKLGERGFMGKTWDTGEVVEDVSFWREVLRVLKPGGHLAAFSASRTYHRMACAIEDAGFEIRDSLMWIYGTGFPKSQNVALAMDKQAGAIGHLAKSFNMKGGGERSEEFSDNGRDQSIRHTPATDAARQWEGFGTALKPAFEPIVLARKPLSEGTVAANVLKWGTGALNIDGCRVGTEGGCRHVPGTGGFDAGTVNALGGHLNSARSPTADGLGRWPANVCHDGSDEVVGMFPHQKSGSWDGKYGTIEEAPRQGSEGSAARFFYSAKASKQDRAGSKHPTVKPVSLMAWLARLITPPGGTILDPFAGSGTTGAAAVQEGFRAILCERESEYVADIRRRFDPNAEPVTAPSGRRISRIFADEKGKRGGRLDRPDFSAFHRAFASERAARAALDALRSKYA